MSGSQREQESVCRSSRLERTPRSGRTPPQQVPSARDGLTCFRERAGVAAVRQVLIQLPAASSRPCFFLPRRASPLPGAEMALLAAVRTTRSLVPAHQDGQQNFLDSLARSGSGPSSTLNGCFGQPGMLDALCRSASSRGWLGSQLPSRGRRSDGEEGESLRLRRALQAASPQALSSAAPAAVRTGLCAGPLCAAPR